MILYFIETPYNYAKKIHSNENDNKEKKNIANLHIQIKNFEIHLFKLLKS